MKIEDFLDPYSKGAFLEDPKMRYVLDALSRSLEAMEQKVKNSEKHGEHYLLSLLMPYIFHDSPSLIAVSLDPVECIDLSLSPSTIDYRVAYNGREVNYRLPNAIGLSLCYVLSDERVYDQATGRAVSRINVKLSQKKNCQLNC